MNIKRFQFYSGTDIKSVANKYLNTESYVQVALTPAAKRQKQNNGNDTFRKEVCELSQDLKQSRVIRH